MGANTTISLGNSPTTTGYITNNGTITVGTGTWTYNGTYALANNGTISTSLTAMDINSGGFTAANGSSFSMSGTTWNVVGDLTINSGATFPTGLNVTFDGGGPSTVTTYNGYTFASAAVSKDNSNISFTVGANTTISLGNSPTTTGYFTNNGTITVGTGTWTYNGSNALSNNGTISLRGTTGYSGTADTDSGTWEYVGDGDGVSDTFSLLDFGASDYFNLTINMTDANDIAQLTAGLAINGALTVTSGILSLNGNNISDIAGGATATLGNIAGTVRLLGSETVFWSTNDTDSGTYEYVGTGGPYTIKDFGASDYYNLTINGSGATFNLGGALDVNGSVTLSAGTLGSNSNDITVGGSWTDTGSGSFTEGIQTVTFDGTGAINANEAFYNVTINTPGTVTLAGAFDVDGAFNLSSGTFNQSTSTMNVAGNFALSNGTAFTKSSNSSALTFDGAGSLTDSNATKQDLGAVTVGGTTVTRTLGAATKMTSLTINSGDTLSLAGYDFSFSSAAAVSNNGIFRLQGNETLTNVNNLDIDSGEVRYVGDGAGGLSSFTIKDFGAGVDYFNLKITNSDTTNETFTAGGNLDINGALTITSGIFAQGANTINLAGNFDLSSAALGSFTKATGGQALTLDGTTTTSVFTSPQVSLGVVILNKTNADSAQNHVDMDSNLTMDTLTVETNNEWQLGSSLTLNGTGSTADVLVFNGTGSLTHFSQTINYAATNSGGNVNVANVTYGALTFSGNETYVLTGNTTTAGTITIGATSTLDAVSGSNYQLNVGGNWANSGTFLARSGTVVFNGTTSVTASNSAFNNLQLGTGTAGGSLTTNVNLDVDGNLTVLNGGATALNISGDQLNVGGNFNLTNLDTYTDDGSTTLVFDGSGSSTLTSAGKTLAAMTVDGTAKTIQLGDALTVDAAIVGADDILDLNGNNFGFTGANTLDNNGTFRLQGGETISNFTNDTNSGTTNYSGTGSYTTSLVAGNNYYNLTFSGNGGVWEPNGAVDVNGALTVSTGATFDIDGQNLDLTGGSFSNDGTLRMQGGETLTAFTNDTNSGTISYDGAGTYASLAAGNNYYGLTIAGNGSFTAAAATDVNGSFTQSAGTFTAPSSNFNLAGNMIRTGGTFAHNSGTVILDGTADQALTTNGAAFNDFTVNNTGVAGSDDITFTGNFDVDGIFTLSDGHFHAPAAMTVGDDFLFTGGTFDSNSGTVTLDTTSMADVNVNGAGTGSISFYDLSITTPGKTIRLGAGDTFNITHATTWTVTGSSGNNVVLESTSSGNAANVNPAGTNFSYVSMKDMNNISGNAINCSAGCVNNGGLSGSWGIGGAVASAAQAQRVLSSGTLDLTTVIINQLADTVGGIGGNGFNSGGGTAIMITPDGAVSVAPVLAHAAPASTATSSSSSAVTPQPAKSDSPSQRDNSGNNRLQGGGPGDGGPGPNGGGPRGVSKDASHREDVWNFFEDIDKTKFKMVVLVYEGAVFVQNYDPAGKVTSQKSGVLVKEAMTTTVEWNGTPEKPLKVAKKLSGFAGFLGFGTQLATNYKIKEVAKRMLKNYKGDTNA